MTENPEKTFIADRKVKGIRTIPDVTTPLGGEIIEIQFEDNSLLEMPMKRYLATRTYKQSDATAERARITEEAGHQILALMHEFGIRFGEVNNLLDSVVRSVQVAHDTATSKLWGVLSDGDQDLNQINRVLVNNGKETINRDGAPSSGSGADSEN
jgi:hypothetical protein